VITTGGQIGYEAYGSAAGWKTFDGRPMPTWEQLGGTDVGRETQRRWECAATAIVLDAQNVTFTGTPEQIERLTKIQIGGAP